MPKPLPAGPFETLNLGNGETAPVYLIPFNKKGRCKGPKTRKHLMQAAKNGGFTHIYLFSHGWNNDFKTALKGYREFFGHFSQVRKAQEAKGNRLPEYKPLLVGVIWPSILLVLPWERPPKIAALPADPTEDPEMAQAGEIDQTVSELDEIAENLPDDQVERFFELAGSGEDLSAEEARELAEILQPLYAASDPDDESEPPSSEELVEIWRALGDVFAAVRAPGDSGGDQPIGDVFGPAGGAADQPQAAGLDKLDPRNAVRAFTVWQMKDRAGKVGSTGVAPLLADLLAAAPNAKTHLIGHSYGCKVVLSATNHLPAGSDKKVASALLLQPAINGWAFAKKVADKNFSGGYRRVLDVVDQPVRTTFSSHDMPLTKLFHLAVRRKGDLGEIKAAAGEPMLYGALGGYGPRGTPAPEGEEILMPANGSPYPDLPPETQVLALKGDQFIDGHGGVRNVNTAWALFDQVRRSSNG